MQRDGSYCISDFELLTAALSAASWRALGGSIRLITDSVAYAFLEQNGLIPLWNGGVTYFRGDFSFVFDEYISGIDGGGVLESQFAFISSQEFINGSLYRHGIVPHDILAHLCMEFYHGDGKLDVAASTLVHFLGKEKPWTLRQKPVWLPQLAFRPHERRRYR